VIDTLGTAIRDRPFSAREAAHMARALRLAARGLETDPNPRVGCVLVKDGRVVGEGWHRRAGGPHAEIEALRDAGGETRGATAYVSLEPCCHHGKTPPCTDALVEAGVERVIAAMADPNPLVGGKGLKILSEAGIEVGCGLLEADAEALNRGFCRRMRTGRPYLFSKLAMSLDGRTAMASGESRWITGPEARADVHRLRARSSAIVTGIGTVLADDPAMTVRLAAGDGACSKPARIVLDSRFRTPRTARILTPPERTHVLGLDKAASHATALADAGAVIGLLPGDGRDRLALDKVADYLGAQQFNEVMIEAGAVLNGAWLTAGLVDEWIVYLSPSILGDQGRGLFHLPGLEKLADRISLRLRDSRSFGQDLRLTFGAA
jgi:diaminohydroxyphosphoribosylaminopyrimidine deaminase / 5-amino-6-(5-phosphoribosylamino)uracil reductase